MKHKISAQELLNGKGFTHEYMLEKAYREFERLKNCREIFCLYDQIMNFSITISLLSDWSFHLLLNDQKRWKNKQENSFTQWIVSQSPEVAAFIDISNEFKHANRRCKNFFAERIESRMCELETLSEQQTLICESKGFYLSLNNGGRKMLCIPFIMYAGKKEFLYDVAESALIWWEKFDPNQAIPIAGRNSEAHSITVK
jgi:hypothetical protein